MTATFWLQAQLGSMFLAPAFAVAGVLAVSIPVALHLLRRQRQRRVVWGAMRFLQLAVEQERRKLLISQWLLLLLRCLAFVLLGLALAQPVVAGWLGGSASRDVHLILDDGLTTRAMTEEGLTRFDQLQAEAIDLVRTLPASDRLTIWLLTGGDPVAFDLHDGGRDEAMAWLDSCRGSDGGTSPASVLARLLRHDRTGAADAVGVWLTDFSVADDRWVSPASSLDEAQTPFRWVLRQPETGRRNDQVTQLVLPQPAVVPQPGGRVVLIPVEAVLTRPGGAAAAETIDLQWEIFDPRGQSRARLRQPVRLLEGDQHRRVRQVLTLPVDARDQPEGRFLIEAAWMRLESPLATDDRAFAVVELRREATVLIQHTGAAGLTTARWFALALSPGAEEDPPLRPLISQRITGQRLTDADVLVLTEPAGLDEAEVRLIRPWLEAGGSLILFPPSDLEAAGWSAPLGLPERVYDTVVEHPEEGRALGAIQREEGLLAALAAEWPTLARTIRVARSRAVMPEGLSPVIRLQGGTQDFWVADTTIGRGRVVVFGSRLEPTETNLPIKPLVVPLVQTLVRDLLGARLGVDQRVVSPSLGVDSRWSPRRLNAATDGSAAEPHRDAGWYVRQDDEAQWLIARPATEAGDLTPAKRAQIERLMPGKVVWAEPNAIVAALDRDPPRSTIGPSVLVAMLLALLAEMVVSRWSSTGERRWW